ncbi:adenosylmethionine-8-amino-7-oxononanoate aminotransferase [Capsulimonas corticalis]|uniref:Adenosylmethionine-8-amino-7-oxononanoate aminotransferase n=1 Tax=Capsulimonas corticalis TaxID=2219043 RepID=A0A9N7L2B5_9BACT|nr:adenosylmethionine--8-amino-7-oxononanoate transaminase [Capsulimonas corticalis]BDI29528.1 adenosylmethionine-8-amino-7-oxononanoate aminotransferase [Capsulimonas corticalis]
MTNTELTQLEKAHLWHPFTQMRDWEVSSPIFIESGQGVKLRDMEGREYYDANSSMWLNVHGHRRPEIDAAVIAQIGKVAHSTMLGLTHEPGARLAARLAALAPPGLTRVFYSDNGSTANEVALKMAFQYWRHQGQDRRRFIALSEGYHGDTIGAVSVGGVGLFHGIFRDLLFEVDFVPSPARAASLEAAVQQMEAALAAHNDEVCAVILEPLVQMAGGILTAPAGYLKAVRELCDRYDVLLIADEVATGFGRTGAMFACDLAGVSPDFLCLGKGLTGGYLPLAATLATDKIYDAFLGDYKEWKSFTHGHSYTGNPLACAAALASLDIFEQEQVIDGLAPKITLIRQILSEIESLPHVGGIRQCGLMAGIEIVRDKSRHELYPFEDAIGVRICRRALAMGLITRPLGHVITFVPPLASSPGELTEMLGILREAIAWETQDA